DKRAPLVTRPFVIVTLTAFVFFLYIGMLLPIVPLFIEGPLGAGEFGIGLTVAVFATAAIAVRPIIGRIADRYGRRILLIGGAVLAGCSGVLSGQVETLWQLMFLRGFTGIGEAAVFVGAATLIADLSPRDRRAEGASYFSVAVFGGIGMGPIFGEWVLDDTRYELAFLVAGLIALLAGLVAILAPVRVASPDGEDDADDIEESPTGRRKFVHPAAVMPGLVLAAGMAAFASFAAFLPDYARSVGLASSGALFGLYALVSVVVRIFGARWPERLGPRVTVTIALSNVMIGLAILAIFPAIWALWAAALFVGLGMAFNYPSLLALTVNRASDRERAWAISSFTMFFELGSAAGGLVIGALAQIVGKQLGFFGGVASCVIGLWLLRSKVVPTDAPDAGPMVTQPTTVT
ncbi:MAG: MFS transporter, partial [Ilumatobacteraceae bacterium]|nr:MFS transporter [Ilumatobacteraceae bacterium]